MGSSRGFVRVKLGVSCLFPIIFLLGKIGHPRILNCVISLHVRLLRCVECTSNTHKLIFLSIFLLLMARNGFEVRLLRKEIHPYLRFCFSIAIQNNYLPQL